MDSMIALRKLFIIFLIPLLTNAVFGQEQYYIYIQSEEHRTFYVRIENETYLSSGTGYLVISKLEKNTYELTIGYPDEKTAEWRFNCAINTTDLGFILKQDKRSGVQLFNLKQQNGLTGTPVQQQREVKTNKLPSTGTEPISNDPFSSLLSEVVNDPSIRKPVIVEQKMVATAPSVKSDSIKSGVVATPAVDQKENAKIAVTDPPPGEDSLKGLVAKASPMEKKVTPDQIAGVEPNNIPLNTGKTKIEEAKKPEPKETKKVEEVKKSEEKSRDIIAKADNAKPSNEKKPQAEPFVVKETPMEKKEKIENSSLPPETQKEEKNENGDPRYLPFAIHPTTPSGEKSSTDQQPEEKSANVPTKTAQKTTVGSKAKESASADTHTNKDSNNDGKEMKYLPFEIKPGEDSEHATDTASAGTVIAPVTDKNNAITSPSSNGKKNSSEDLLNEKAGKNEPLKKEEKGNMLPAETIEKKDPLSSVRKTMERKSRDGVDLIYIDEHPGGSRDTIRIFIPAVK